MAQHNDGFWDWGQFGPCRSLPPCAGLCSLAQAPACAQTGGPLPPPGVPRVLTHGRVLTPLTHGRLLQNVRAEEADHGHPAARGPQRAAARSGARSLSPASSRPLSRRRAVRFTPPVPSLVASAGEQEPSPANPTSGGGGGGGGGGPHSYRYSSAGVAAAATPAGANRAARFPTSAGRTASAFPPPAHDPGGVHSPREEANFMYPRPSHGRTASMAGSANGPHTSQV